MTEYDDKVIPLEEFGKRGTLTVYNQAYVEELEAKIAHLTRHLEPQSMSALFEQVEEEVKQEQKIKKLEEELEHERKINEEIKVRFVKCNSCTEEMKNKCLMFSENLCEGERCEELVDLVALVTQSELQNRCAELEKKISVLLSCKNCPDNKGGYICQKEYEDKCLAQKIQYIKELKEEKGCETCVKFDEVKLTKAKELIRQLCSMVRERNKPNVQLTNVDYSLAEAEQFLKENE